MVTTYCFFVIKSILLILRFVVSILLSPLSVNFNLMTWILIWNEIKSNEINMMSQHQTSKQSVSRLLDAETSLQAYKRSHTSPIGLGNVNLVWVPRFRRVDPLLTLVGSKSWHGKHAYTVLYSWKIAKVIKPIHSSIDQLKISSSHCHQAKHCG